MAGVRLDGDGACASPAWRSIMRNENLSSNLKWYGLPGILRKPVTGARSKRKKRGALQTCQPLVSASALSSSAQQPEVAVYEFHSRAKPGASTTAAPRPYRCATGMVRLRVTAKR